MSLSPYSHAQQARQALALRLAELRREAGLTGRELGRLCGWHPSKTSRIENARTAPTADDVTAWCGACGVPAAAADLIASLRAAEGMWVEWRRMERSGPRQAQVNRLPLYERTQRFRSYSSWLVPGLLQTRSYTAAVLGAVQRRRGPVDDVTEAVDARMDRQRVLHEGDRRFAFLVEESVLRAGVGGAQVMTAQLGALVAASSLPNVSVGIVAASPDRERWPVEGFWIYDSAQVNVELVSGYLTVTAPSEVASYAATFSELAECAFHGTAARRLITTAMAALDSPAAQDRSGQTP
ncbi:helix-turn-helix transcriptional regulator [Streptomyces sp. SS07]|uniref:helix-turn-helix domain-containing protein n=1 Tax=Streptomyces sp. SS07 TaxID=2015315 RepID=UPI000B5C94F8|nr:helix-turn-helix transcriptional regulator [Streptomyces sp. SS07]